MYEEDLKFWIRAGIIAGAVVIGVLFYRWLSSPLVVQVSGVGEVKAPASTAAIGITVTDNNPSAVIAVSNAQTKADAIRKILTTKGFAAGDIAQSQVTVVPAAVVAAGLTGYQATISIGGKTTQVADLPQLVGSLYERGAAYVSQPTLTVDNRDDLENQAVQAAMKDAAKKADQIAKMRFKFIKTIAGIVQTDTALTGTATTKGDVQATKTDVTASGDTFKIAKSVDVTYRMW